ncbi:sensor histidine kinase [Amycolatopsis sp. GM8]|uniref:sensor histidine kinase n=1 Tax=Amycolatopsis sp. GM8 TaxID=2896530 RepID=UPI001F3E8C88|nr:sensor histidine kinase [Amycolatopsis sp. GM8]
MNSTLPRLFAALRSRQFRGELVWVLFGFPPTLLFVVVLLVWLVLGIGLSPLFLGVLLAAGALLTMRKLGGLHRRLARALLDAQVSDPPAPVMRPGLWGWLRARIGDPVAWRSFGYLLVRLPLSLLNLTVAGALLMYGLGCLSYPFYYFATGGNMLPIFSIHTSTWPASIPVGALGAVLVLATPWVLHGLTAMDRVLVFSLLGPTTLSERVRDLEESRANAIEDATVRLRRIERDLHDGAQAQLVALAMKLGIARDELENGDADLGGVRKLVDAAHGDAKQALAELRDLARGIRPPALDAGLDVALTTLAARSAVDVRLRVDLPERPSPAIETLLYFTAAELLTNAVKHGGAPVVHLDVTAARLTVTDEGTGGARIVRGGGLAGVAERLGTVDGRLDIDSPPGGPTVITAHVLGGG